MWEFLFLILTLEKNILFTITDSQFAFSLSQIKLSSLKPDFVKFVFIVCSSRGLPNYNKTKVRTTCFLYEAFLKHKNRSKTSLPASFPD